MTRKKSDSGSLAKQIDSARKNIESWPSWLRESARFAGQNHAFDQHAPEIEKKDDAFDRVKRDESKP